MIRRSWQTVCVGALIFAGCSPINQPDETRISNTEAWDLYGMGAFDPAIRMFHDVVKRSPDGSEEKLEALYGLGTVWDLRRPGNDPKVAEEFYQKVIATGARSEYAAWSLLALARMQAIVPVGQQPDRDAVHRAYQKVIDLHPFTRAGEEAFVLQQVPLIQTFQKEEAQGALDALGEFVKSHPNSDFLSLAHSLMAECHRVLGDPDQRLAEEINALALRERKLHEMGFAADTTTFKIAHIAEFEAGDFETARHFYRRFLQENPTEKRCFFAQQALDRMDRVEVDLRAQSLAKP